MAGLRPTRQRVALAELLFAKGDRHLSAEELHEEAQTAGVAVSLATVYNTLHQFNRCRPAAHSRAGERAHLFRHQHLRSSPFSFIEGENRIMDIDHWPVTVSNLPEPPEGMEVANVDIIVRASPEGSTLNGA